MLHVWLIPSAVVVAVVIIVLYFALKAWGGDGVRTEGRTLFDEPEESDSPEEDR